jgi:hypothetical protein
MKQNDIKILVINELLKTWKDRDGNTVSHSREPRNVFTMVLKEAEMFNVKMNGNSASRIADQVLRYFQK